MTAVTDVENKTPTNDATPSEQEEETRPTHTAEIGTLKKLSVPGGTAWLGSSSGGKAKPDEPQPVTVENPPTAPIPVAPTDDQP